MERTGWIPAIGVAAALLSARAYADDVAAPRALFDKGLAEMQAGRYESGCPRLGESYRLDPRPGTLFTLAECEAKRGRIATAVARYSEYLSLYDRMPPEQRAKQLDRNTISARQKAALSPKVPELTLILPKDAPRGTVVKRDDVVLDAPSLGIGLPVDPGDHVVTTQAPGGPETPRHVTVKAGEHPVIELEVQPPGPIAAAAAPADETLKPAGSSRRTIAYVVGGVGVAEIAVGAITGGLMLSKKGAINSGCRDGSDGVKLCTPDGAAAGQSAKTLGAVSSVGFALGLAGAGAAVVLIVTDPGPDAGRAPSSVALGVIGAGPGGAMIGARGSW
jgi:hypothetical protein